MASSADRSPWLVLGGVWLIAFFLYILMQSISPLLPVLITDFKLSHGSAGFLYSLPILMIGLTSYPLGILSDRIGMKRAVGCGATLAVLSSLLRPLSSDFYFLAFATVLFGLGFAMCFPNLPKLVKEYFPPSLSGTATGAYTTAIPLGSGLGISLTKPLLTVVGGWREALFAWSFMSIPVIPFWWLVTRAGRKTSKGPGSEVGKTESSRNSGSDQPLSDARGRLFGPVLITGLLLALLNLIFFCTIGWLPTYLSERGWNPTSAAAATSMISFIEVPGVLLIPALSDRIGRRRLIIAVSYLVIAICSVVVSFYPSLSWWVTPFFGITFGGVFALILALPLELVERKKVGRAAGAVLSVGYIGAFLGPPVTGYLRDWAGDFKVGFLVMATAAIAAMALSYALPRSQPASRPS